MTATNAMNGCAASSPSSHARSRAPLEELGHGSGVAAAGSCPAWRGESGLFLNPDAREMFTAQNGGPYGFGAAIADSRGSLIVMKRGQNVGYQSCLIPLPGEGGWQDGDDQLRQRLDPGRGADPEGDETPGVASSSALCRLRRAAPWFPFLASITIAPCTRLPKRVPGGNNVSMVTRRPRCRAVCCPCHSHRSRQENLPRRCARRRGDNARSRPQGSGRYRRQATHQAEAAGRHAAQG